MALYFFLKVIPAIHELLYYTVGLPFIPFFKAWEIRKHNPNKSKAIFICWLLLLIFICLILCL